MKLVPLGDRVVLKQLIAEETTKSGIVIPGQSKEKPQQAEVIAVGAWRNSRRKRSSDERVCRTDGHLLQICGNHR